MMNNTRWLCTIAIFLFQSNVFALELKGSSETIDRPSQRFLNAPKLSEPKPSPILPPPTVPEDRKFDSGEIQSRFYLKKIHLQGNTVFSNDELAMITKNYENRQVTPDDLRQLRQDLTVHYIQNGYINSGALLPNQAIENGELVMQIVEGKLTEIQVEGLKHLQPFYLKSRINYLDETPLNIKELQDALQILQQNPLINRINAELLPGLKQGEAILRTNVEEARPYFVTLGANNNGVPTVGAERFEMWAGHRNLFGIGDAFNGNFNISVGQRQYNFDYAVPFTSLDTTLNLRYQRSDADVVEKPFDQLNIFNMSETFGVGISQPVFKTLENQVTLGLMAERRHSETFLEDIPFSFSRGSVNGASNVSVLRFSQDWLNQTDRRVLALRSSVNLGVNALGATIHSQNLPDGRYLFWSGQAQWIQRLWDTGIEMHLQGNSQISASPLLSLEQFALGGMNSVRGYRKNQMVRDNGFSSTLEFRVPVIENLVGRGVLHVAPFFDFGRTWYDDIKTDEPSVLASAGIGLHIDPIKQWHLECYWAQPLRKMNTIGGDLQDYGVNFVVNYSPL